jgi:colanic acid biosynthesis glycosyl transferase WcaI
MRILIYGINYAPDLTGIGKYTGEMAGWLVKSGHTVHAITAMPYYPQWQINVSYKGKWWHKEYIDGVKVYRCPLYVPQKVSSLKRIVHEFSFILSTIPVWLRILFRKKYDVVISVAPPFHLGLLPLIYTKLKVSKMVTHIQDLQVDVAKQLGMIKNSRFLNLMLAFEKFILKRSNSVSTISKGMKTRIEGKGIDPSKCMIFPNWVDEKIIFPLGKNRSLRTEFGFSDDDKVILYSGNLGEKQGLENIIEVARSFRDEPQVKFVIIGSGGCEDKLKAAAKNAGLANIYFHALLPYEKLSASLAMADIHLVLQKKQAEDLVMPSKLISILAAGGCPLVTASKGSSLHELISKNNMGIVVEPDDTAALNEGIRNALRKNLETVRSNARNYARKFLAKESILRNWEIKLFRLIGIVPLRKPEVTFRFKTESPIVIEQHEYA